MFDIFFVINSEISIPYDTSAENNAVLLSSSGPLDKVNKMWDFLMSRESCSLLSYLEEFCYCLGRPFHQLDAVLAVGVTYRLVCAETGRPMHTVIKPNAVKGSATVFRCAPLGFNVSHFTRYARSRTYALKPDLCRFVHDHDFRAGAITIVLAESRFQNYLALPLLLDVFFDNYQFIFLPLSIL